MMAFIQRRLGATAAEVAAALWSFGYFFALLASYYVLRPLRDEMALVMGPQVMQQMFTSVFVAMVAIVPVFGWLNRRVPRRTLLPWLYGFFIANLIGFFTVMKATGPQPPWLARVFFVWVSVFVLFAVSVFWSFMADLFTTDQAKRLYGFIAAGGTAGALVGPGLTAALVGFLGVKVLMLVAAAFLAFATLAITRLRTWAATTQLEDRGAGAEPEPLRGGLFSGLCDLFRSSYLAAICFFLLVFTLLSTFLYFQTAALLPKSVPNSVRRVQLLAQLDLAVNGLALLLQVGVFRRLITRWGTGFALALMPIVSAIGFAVLALRPTLAVLLVFGVVRRAGEYAISKPARETLFNRLTPEQKYKAKNVIDTLVHRTGDTASAWAYNGLRAVGLAGAALSWMSVPLALAWTAVAVWLGKTADRPASG